MTNPTSNFNWQMPENTDLVTNLPADFEVFGQAVDTDFADLLGGTTGQVLSKTSNTDLDFTWTSANPGDITGVTAGTGISGGGTSGTVTVTNDMATTITAAGDIVVGTGSGTYDNLPIGTTNQVLTADTSVSPYKVKWAAASSGSRGLNQIIPTSVNVGSGSASVGANGKVTVTGVNTNMSINGVFSSTYTNYKVLFNVKTGSSYSAMAMRMRVAGVDNTTSSSYRFNNVQAQGTNFSSSYSAADKFGLIEFISTNSACGGEINFYDPFLVTQTSISQNSSVGFAVGDLYNMINAGSQTGAISFDGFSFLITTAITGSILIYGWSE